MFGCGGCGLFGGSDSKAVRTTPSARNAVASSDCLAIGNENGKELKKWKLKDKVIQISQSRTGDDSVVILIVYKYRNDAY